VIILFATDAGANAVGAGLLLLLLLLSLPPQPVDQAAKAITLTIAAKLSRLFIGNSISFGYDSLSRVCVHSVASAAIKAKRQFADNRARA
jgi:hypothetical protein